MHTKWILIMVLSFIWSDIDECVQGSDGCSQNCTNTIGSYFCTCMDGYELESDNHTCTGDAWIPSNYCTTHKHTAVKWNIY